MFTGIIEELGTVEEIRKGVRSAVLAIRGCNVMKELNVGDSVAVNGVCLTVSKIRESSFIADVMNETLQCSTLRNQRKGNHVNLERAMKVNDRFGGHFVTGHIDSTGIIDQIEKTSNAIWYTIISSQPVMRYLVKKGSVAIDGISLTVAEVYDDSFSVSTIPHTNKITTLSEKKVGDLVNLEVDVLGKYIEKLLYQKERKQSSGITREYLTKFGY